MILAISVV